MNFLTTTYSFKFKGLEVVLLLFIIVLLLTFTSLYLRSRYTVYLHQQNQPKTGFLGKQLMQFVGLLIMVSAIAGAVIMAQKPKDFVSQADKQVSVDLEYSKQKIDTTQTKVTLRAIPSIDSVKWGKNGEKFDVIWDIKTTNGLINSSQKSLLLSESARTSSSPSHVLFNAKAGTYKVKSIVTYSGGSYSKELTIVL